MRKTTLLLTALATTTITAAVSYAQSPAAVPYPQGYRYWAHVKSMVIDKGHPLFDSFGGIHHIYANTKALRGYSSGKFADGAVLVFDLLEATKTADSAVVEGQRKVVGVMHKDAKKYAATGGWGYEGFKGGSTTERVVGAKAVEACAGCHEGQKAKGYVFSTYRK